MSLLANPILAMHASIYSSSQHYALDNHTNSRLLYKEAFLERAMCQIPQQASGRTKILTAISDSRLKLLTAMVNVLLTDNIMFFVVVLVVVVFIVQYHFCSLYWKK